MALLSFPIRSGFCRLLCLLALVLAVSAAATAQGTELLDSRGKDFRITFLPNLHANALDDSLHIFLTAEKPTQGVIRYYDINSAEKLFPFTISQPNQIVHFSTTADGHELVGFLNDGLTVRTPQNEQEAPQVFHITADEEITVYGLSQSMYTSDAFLALPVDVLGTDYVVLSYNSDGLVSSQRTPSQFAIVAVEDNTTVTIVPSVATSGGGAAARTITLDAGLAYLVQASIATADPTADLTGTIINADKPIAVFAGHQRATLPIGVGALNSRDHLVEQLLPVPTWGRSAFVVPYVQPPDQATDGTDLFRVLAAYDGTQVFIDGVLTATLNEGEFLERPLEQPLHITATAQILVAQYKKTSGDVTSPTAQQTADPFMMLIPPSEQFLESYSFINAQGIQNDFSGERQIAYTEQYITIVIPESHRSTVTIDGVLRTNLQFQQLGSTGYLYAHVTMADGAHTITADTTFGLYVYGYGPANSYGYIGGLLLQELAKDGIPPQILGTDSCYTLFGMVFDTLSTDTRIRTVEAPPAQQINTAVTISPFTPLADSVGFRAVLTNIYDDGECTLVAVDSVGQRAEEQFLIPGFTVHVDPAIRTDEVVSRSETISSQKERCIPLTLTNYGRAVQTIDTMLFLNGGARFTLRPAPVLPLVLQPGDTRTLTVCFISDTEGEFADTLALVNRCTPRSVAAFAYRVVEDRVAPDLSMDIDSCGTRALIAFVDSSLVDLGIARVVVREAVNCTVETDSSALPKLAQVRITVADPDYDAVFAVEASDLRGNTSYLRDTIQGYTLRFAPAGREVQTYADVARTLRHCDSVLLYNYGLLPFTVNEVFLAGNTGFSAPLSQFPLVIPPGDSAGVIVCFNPREQQMYDDTLVIPKYCRTIALPLQGTGIPRTVLATGDPRCGVSVTLSSSAPGDVAPIVYPNPADQTTTIRIHVREHSAVVLRIAGMTGTELSASSTTCAPGVYDLTVDTSTLESGVYFCELFVGTQRTVLPLHVLH